MPTAQVVMDELKSKGNEKTRATYARHGMASERVYGVTIADLKVIAKRIRGEQALALELYATGVMDAMYLAGMVADGARMSRKELQDWAEGAVGMQMISEHTVPWVTVENEAARELAVKWIRSTKDHVAAAGWRTYAGLLATKPDESLDLGEIEGLLILIANKVADAPNRPKSTMNSFVIAVGTYIRPLSAKAKATAKKIGSVSVDVGDTACKVSVASESIAKVEAAGKAGRKKKTIRC